MARLSEYDAIVVGAGPAGSSAAAVLGAAGKRTLLLDRDRFPREKTCGDGITFKCFPALKRLGLLDDFFKAVRVRTRGYSLVFSNGQELAVRQPEGDRAPVYVLPRYDFDQLILSAALRERQVQLVSEVRAESLQFDADKVVGVIGSLKGAPFEARAPLVIDACGANTPLAVQVGAGNRDPRRCALAIRGYYQGLKGLSDLIELYFDREILPGYFWIFPTSPTTANIGCGTFQHLVEERKIDLRAVLRRFFEQHPVVREKLSGATLCGELKGGKIPLALSPIDAEGSSRVRDGLILVGDAASFTDPITAEGISYALNSGLLAGEVGSAALDRRDLSAESLSPYDSGWRAEFGRQFARAPVLTTPLSKELFARQLQKSFEGSTSVDAAVGHLDLQYELMVKLKVLLKAL